MPENTSKLQLVKQQGAEQVSVDLLNSNFDTLDNNPGVFVCTSTTRPTGPWTGRMIYETDSQLVRVWNGTEWARFEADGGLLKGFRLLGKNGSQTVNAETADINRFEGRNGDPGDAGSFIKVASNTSTSAPSTIVTVQRAGRYRIDLRVVFQQTNAGLATNTASLMYNSTTYAADGVRRNWAAEELGSLHVNEVFALSAGNTIRPLFNAGALTAVYSPVTYWTTLNINYEGPS